MIEEKQCEGMTYLVSWPDNMDRTQTYPMVLYLHGAGTRSDTTVHLRTVNRGFHHLVPYCADKAVLVAPLCSDIDWNAYMPTLIRLTERFCAEPFIDAARVYLTGLSMGGFGTFALSILRPNLFAAIMPLCGGGAPWEAYRLEHVPCRVFHGTADDVVSPDLSRAMVEHMNRAGGHAELILLEGYGHNVWDKVYTSPEHLSWLFSQRRNNEALSADVVTGKTFG